MKQNYRRAVVSFFVRAAPDANDLFPDDLLKATHPVQSTREIPPAV
jgi:hypothetical protein